jgi:3-phosphoglycerate kinase
LGELNLVGLYPTFPRRNAKRFVEGVRHRTAADSFVRALAKLGDVYVNDAFGAAHRAHASTAGVPKYLLQAAMGLLMERELQYLKDELANPDRPFLVILGGSKVSDKIAVIKALMEKADVFLVGVGFFLQKKPHILNE